MQETQVQFLGWENPLEKEMATHSSIIAWVISWTEEPGRLQSMGLQTVRNNLATKQQQSLLGHTAASSLFNGEGSLDAKRFKGFPMATLNTSICRCTGELSCERTFLVWEPVSNLVSLWSTFVQSFTLISKAIHLNPSCYVTHHSLIQFQTSINLHSACTLNCSTESNFFPKSLYSPHLTDRGHSTKTL